MARSTGLALAFCAAMVVAPAAAGQQAPAPAPTRYDSIFDQLMALPTLVRGAGAVRGLSLRRDAAEFRLDSGKVYLLGPVAGRTVGAVFLGTGTLSFVPPIRVEQEELQQVLKQRELKRQFGKLFLLFADSTAAELERGFSQPSGSEPLSPMIQGTARKGLDYLSHRGRRYFDSHTIAPFLNAETGESFFAMLDDVPGGPLLVQIDPYELEEVSLSRGRAGTAVTDNRSEVVSRFDWARNREAGSEPDERKERVSIEHYAIHADIGKSLDFRAAARLRLRWFGKPAAWMSFFLLAELQVDSAVWEGRGAAVLVWKKGNPMSWVRAPDVAAGQPWPELVVYYHGGHGDLLQADGPWIDLRDSNGWYPSLGIAYGMRSSATFDLRFRTPRNLKFASIGERTESRVEGDVLHTRWVTSEPAFHASFNIGKFEDAQLDDPRAFPVRVLINEAAHNEVPSAFQRRDGSIQVIPRQARMKETVGEDVVLSLAFFRDVFGDPPTKQFSATEISGGHGQAFPGLIHFSWATFHGFLLAQGEDEAFRAHEVAHQWWGLGVGPGSYRDAWISEGFAEFASWWYTETVMGDSGKKVVSEILKGSRERLLARRNLNGPIWLGTRLGTGTRYQDWQEYTTTIYDKGAWVLRMLRHLMTDSEKGDEAFRRMMREFYQNHRGGLATTADFQAIVERYVEAPMDWFFNSWVRGAGIPTYEWAHQTGAGADGKPVIRFQVTQKDVPEEFAMMVPVSLQFADGRTGDLSIMVKGARTETSHALAAKPNKVVFNPDHAVLAQVKDVKWR